MTQFSPLIGRHDYFLKGKVNNEVLSRILNAETIMAVMNDQVKTVWGKILKNQNWTKQSAKFSDWICRILGLRTVVGFGGFSVVLGFFLLIFGFGCFLKAGGNPPSPHSQDKYYKNILTPWCRSVLCECPCCALLQCKSSCLLKCSLCDLGSLPSASSGTHPKITVCGKQPVYKIPMRTTFLIIVTCF